MTPLNRREWERRHGKGRHHPDFAALGWRWTPVPCKCPKPCYIVETMEEDVMTTDAELRARQLEVLETLDRVPEVPCSNDSIPGKVGAGEGYETCPACHGKSTVPQPLVAALWGVLTEKCPTKQVDDEGLHYYECRCNGTGRVPRGLDERPGADIGALYYMSIRWKPHTDFENNVRYHLSTKLLRALQVGDTLAALDALLRALAEAQP